MSTARLAARVALWQVTAAGGLLLAGRPSGALAGVAAVGLVAVTATRFSGRWCDEWVAAYLRYRRRTERSRRGRAAGPLDAVVPGRDTRAHADRGGNRVGLLADRPAWTAVLRLDPIPEDQLLARLDGLLGTLADTVHSGDVRLAAVQLVGWAVPAPGQGRALRAYWVAVRFDPDLDPAAVQARGGGEQGAIRSAAVAALRLSVVLRQRGYPLRVLDGTELSTELASSLGEGPVTRETWRSWSLGALHHACFRPRRAPRHRAGLATMLTWLARPPAVSTCVSVLFSRQHPHGRAVVRVAVPADAGRPAVRAAVRRAAAGFGGYLTPMNGGHLAGVRATVPLGVTA